MNKRHPVLSVVKHDMEVINTKNIRKKQLLPTSAADCPEARLAISGVRNGLPSEDDLPTFPDSVFENLPVFLQKVVARCDSNEDRDMLLVGSMVTLGSCLPKVYGIYGGKRVYPFLYLFITAQASAGKGNLVHCRQLVNPIHDSLREQTRLAKEEYKIGMKQYNLLKWKEAAVPKPDRPPELMLFIPANNSASGVFELLHENNGQGLLFETEGDTLSHAFKSHQSDYSDGMRKIFQHEMISLNRRTGHEHFEIKNPRMAAVFSCTPHQVLSLINDAENGLLSRILFYHMNLRAEWKDMLAPNMEDMEEYFDSLGKEFYPFYKVLDKHLGIRFCLTDQQHEQFNVFFSQLQEKYLRLKGTDYMATIRRLGLIAFRMAMILTALRIMESGNFSQKQECSDSDFQRVISMIRVLVRHSSHMFSMLPEVNHSAKLKDKKEQFLEHLPEKFNRQAYLDLAKSLLIHQRTADRYIVIFCDKGLLFKEQHGMYTKLALSEANKEE
ncbi:MAG TPA: DNA primase [Prolixibacteraceae bacterium]|jgi:hypothetical protein|nr:DNA primase [Prolixibacteraceae bacterium]